MPKILREKEILKRKMFSIKELEIKTKKGNVVFDVVEKKDSVMIVPITDDGKLVLIKEYFAATDDYQIGLPKGRIEDGDVKKATNRELQEEIGYKSKKLTKLATVSVSPGNIRHKTHIFLAQELVESKLEGDEIGKIKVIKVPFANFGRMIGKEITEARMIAALYLAKRFLEK